MKKSKSIQNYDLKNKLELHNIIVVVSSIFQDNKKYYPQIFAGDCLLELAE